MSEVYRLPNPPITEALLDIRVSLPKETDLKRLATFQHRVKDHYPTREERVSWEAGFQVKGGVPSYSPAKGGVNGYFFRALHGKKIVQARLDGFTFNQLKPYEGWSKLLDEAKELWDYYVETANPLAVTRVALRYINRIEIPLPFDDFKEYILTVPEIAPGVPQGLGEFLVRLVIPDEKRKATAIITETLGSVPPEATILPLIFDIDVFQVVNLEPKSQEIWTRLESLRELKNVIFFRSTTQKAKELFR